MKVAVRLESQTAGPEKKWTRKSFYSSVVNSDPCCLRTKLPYRMSVISTSRIVPITGNLIREYSRVLLSTKRTSLVPTLV